MTTYDLRKAQKEIRDGKPTIEEIKRKFEEAFVSVGSYKTQGDYPDVWNFFEPYLKGIK
jgi:hypothetical protein